MLKKKKEIKRYRGCSTSGTGGPQFNPQRGSRKERGKDGERDRRERDKEQEKRRKEENTFSLCVVVSAYNHSTGKT
jgi:hypothetical protein